MDDTGVEAACECPNATYRFDEEMEWKKQPDGSSLPQVVLSYYCSECFAAPPLDAEKKLDTCEHEWTEECPDFACELCGLRGDHERSCELCGQQGHWLFQDCPEIAGVDDHRERVDCPMASALCQLMESINKSGDASAYQRVRSIMERMATSAQRSASA